MTPGRFKLVRGSLGKLATAGAWFFIVVSLLHLAWAIGVKWTDPAGTVKLYHVVIGDVSYDAWGLTYTGVFGLVLAMIEGLVVSTAAVASTLPFEKTLKARRAGHLVLVAWSALWTVNMLWLTGLDLWIDSIAQSALVSGLLACTCWRAVAGWSPGRDSGSVSAPPAEAGNDAHEDRHDPGSARTARAWHAMAGRCRSAGRTLRSRAAVGLIRVGDFTHRQAARVAPDTSKR